ncbi:WASH complex subunit 4 [Copidosoma floridanum]|uniref:WASH complex subunit 4 n=1 Tax=Copidosoma floridanum TaxID=29053 RepID=UPI000C6F8243|nr:WASH complex subunit 4 [Copidosoma floridanum]
MMEEQMFDLKRGGMMYKAAGAAQLRKYGQYFEYLENTCWQVSPALEYIAEGPVRLTYKINEDINVSSLAETGNTFFSKILTTVCGTCREIRLLKAEAKKFYNKLIIHGEQCTDHTVYKIGSLFLDLQDLSIYVNRISTVIYLIIQQLSYLAHSTHREIYLPLLIEHLIDLFVILVTFDEVISGQPAIIEQWKIYQIKVRSVIHNSLYSNTPHKEILSYEKLLKNLHSQLLSKTLFLKSIEHVMDINKSAVMGNHIICFLKNIMLHIEDKVSNNVVVHRNWIRANVGVVVLFKLFGVCDKKLLKRVVDVNKKLYVVSLFGNVVWLPQDFLVNRLPREGLSSISTQAGEKFLAARMQKFPVIVNNLVQRAMLWCIEMKVLIIKTGFQIFSEIERKRNLLLDILALVCQMREDVLVVTNLHGFLMKPMSRSTVQLVCRLVEAQKALEISFYTFAPRIVLAQSQVLQQLTYQILAILELVRKALGQTGTGSGGAVSYSSERLDALSLICLSARLLNGPASPERRLVLRCALVCASQLTENFREDEVIRLRFFLDTYDAIIDLFEQLAFNCDYLVLLQQQAMLPAYLTLAAETGVGPLGHLSRMLQAFNSAVLQQKSAVMPIFRLAEKRSTLSCCLLEPTCRDMETELRLHVYSHLRTSMDSVNTITRLRDGTRLVRAEPLILIGGLLLSGRRYVEHYLDVTFYNLTSVALHDWRAYDSMHALAKHKFRIENVSEQLPTQTLEQGLDALEIMRNIHVFVSCYFYNLHMQTFIEQMSTGRHLNTIGIRHVANSIRTHGIGIISTSVNFVYQFLCVKLHTLSQFLFDEHIKSRLSRDIHYVRLQKERVALAYGYERAEKFQRAIRKLGMTSEGLSYLDQFRQLITQIGNALGYVRLIRSAGLHASAKTVAFLPPKVCHVSPSAENYARKVSMRFSLKSVQAAANRLDADLANLGRNFTEGTHYFQLLVDVFAVAFRDPGKYKHLQQFYAIIPPLTLSFIDCTLDSKEKLFKKKNSGAAFTDDGFAIGLAYINALLGQSSVFDSLQWFKTVQKHLIIQKDAVKSQAEHEDEKLRQTRALTLKRLEERSAEFQLLYYTLSGARVLFK